MFSFFKKPPQVSRSKLFRLTLHVGRGTNGEMPANLVGAYVPAFVGATSHKEAATKAVQALTKQGYEFKDIADGKIYEVDPARWSGFVEEAWPEFTSVFPAQSTVLAKLEENQFIFIGPFASYEATPGA